METRPFAPGFRLSAIDVGVLVIGAVGSVLVAQLESWLGFAIAFTVGHFFLFCNVFRMPRPLELIWAGVFLTLICSTIILQQPGIVVSFVLSLVATMAVVIYQMRQPSYHGVGWRRLNPRLPQWWHASGNDAALNAKR